MMEGSDGHADERRRGPDGKTIGCHGIVGGTVRHAVQSDSRDVG
jgi:hypothetical protein